MFLVQTLLADQVIAEGSHLKLENVKMWWNHRQHQAHWENLFSKPET